MTGKVQSPIVQQPEKKLEDPVARSMAKPEPFAKPASFNKPVAPKSSPKTRVRVMDWKRGRGRPRKTARDVRDVKFF